jgi:hypothetical protein
MIANKISQLQKDNLFKAFALFIEAFRPYVVSVLQKKAGNQWPDWYVEVLSIPQKDKWNQDLKAGTSPATLIDYLHLKSFVLKYKDLLKEDFGKEVHNLATQLGMIYDVRNKLTHFNDLTEDDFTGALIQMKSISRSLGMSELETALVDLQQANPPVPTKPTAPSIDPAQPLPLRPWFRVVKPHFDIQQGRLDESIFAANLAEVALGNGREVYKNPVVFFSKTYVTAGLKNVAKTVIKGLNGQEDAENRVISLQTGFGGGKTHTLISLYHLCQWGKKATQSQYAQELLAYTGNPDFDTAKVAVFTNTTNDAANGRDAEDGVHIQTIWGELAYQLGGKSAYDIIRKNDEQLIAPAGLFKKVLEQCQPALLLIDELADYCVKASARKAGNSSLADQTISFMQELTEAVAATNHCVAVITLPASPQEVGNTPEAQAILSSLQKRVSRVGADTQPVAEDEIYEVIRRRLFEEVGNPDSMEAVASKYLEMYQQYWTELPSHANKTEYKQRILKSYPFHPELIDIFRIRWASHHDFQRTRGVLRLLAAIVSDLWRRQGSLTGSNLLIHPGDVNFANLDAMSGQLKKLYGNGYDAVITADVAGGASNAFKIDQKKTEYGQWYLTQSISSVILMNSFGSDGANKGVSVPEIKLQLLAPNGFNHNSINGALDEMESADYYLYYAQGASKRYWFHTKPNINILINQAKGNIKEDEVIAEILLRVREQTKAIQLFQHPLVDPGEDIPEQMKPTLVILSPRYLASPSGVSKQTKPLIEKMATKKGNSDRIYRNTMLFLVCSEIGISKLHSDVREYLSCKKISVDYQSQLEREQKEDVKKRLDEASKQANTSLVAAYSVVVKHSVKNGLQLYMLKQFKESLDHQLNYTLIPALKEEEWLLESLGLGTLKANNLYPTVQQAIKTKDVYEAFLRFDDKPMITGPRAVADSLQRYCTNGEYAIATGDSAAFTSFYFKQTVPYFEVSDATYWLVDKSLIPQQPLPNPLPDKEEENSGGDKGPSPLPPDPDKPTELEAITISGRVPLERYTELFNYFITPFAMAGNKIEIEVKFKIKSSNGSPLDESKQSYKSAKEAAKQLGLKFEEEE